MSIHNEDTMKMELVSLPSASPLPPAQDSGRSVFLAISIVAVFAFLCGLELWRIVLAFMVVHIMTGGH